MSSLPELYDKIEVYLSLGTNIGDRNANLVKALDALDNAFGRYYDALSGFYETEPWGFESDTEFLNAAVKYSFYVPRGTDMYDFGKGILRKCKEIEHSMGRTGTAEYDSDGKRIYSSRIIDIDILLTGDSRIDMEDLKVPHPLMAVREFVMIPLMDIASADIKSAFPDVFAGK